MSCLRLGGGGERKQWDFFPPHNNYLPGPSYTRFPVSWLPYMSVPVCLGSLNVVKQVLVVQMLCDCFLPSLNTVENRNANKQGQNPQGQEPSRECDIERHFEACRLTGYKFSVWCASWKGGSDGGGKPIHKLGSNWARPLTGWEPKNWSERVLKAQLNFAAIT